MEQIGLIILFSDKKNSLFIIILINYKVSSKIVCDRPLPLRIIYLMQ